jgi:predicted dehydrogenase
MASRKKIRYAVVGLGHIAQAAVLPAFRHASENSELAALVSSNRTKLRDLGKRYGVSLLLSYAQYDELLRSRKIDAVYIALPNHQHSDFTIRAARAGIHVLCEKPMAVTERECRAMINACERNDVRLMIAYRLHFDAANLTAVKTVTSGKLGDPRIFSSVFTMDVKEGNIRLRGETGGGTLYDIGVYCINAARYLFRDEPIEVAGMIANKGTRRFAEVEEMFTASLRFPGERIATFVCSFGSADVARFQVVGTKGNLQLDPAYEYAIPLELEVRIGEKTDKKKYPKRDQFAPEIVYFSDCVMKNREPEPNGWEGLADVRVVEALYRSAKAGKAVTIKPVRKTKRPTLEQQIRKPPVRKPKTVKATPPTRE